MAQADGIVSNASGAAVRADINNQLAALFTNHSGATEPATTYAYQFWADTTAGQLKLRNSSNTDWITLIELDGTTLMEDGTVSAPGLAFADDTNTGFYRPAADSLGIATNGTNAIYIDSSQNVGIGTTSPESPLHVAGSAITFEAASDPGTLTIKTLEAGGAIQFRQSSATSDRYLALGKVDNADTFYESCRIDDSLRLLVGATTARSNLYGASYAPITQIETTGTLTERTLNLTYNANGGGAGGPLLSLAATNGGAGSNTVVANGQELGGVNFLGADGTKPISGASITAYVDGTPGSNDMPGRLVFSTTADGASSPTERLRIDSSGDVGIGTSSPISRLTVQDSSGNSLLIGYAPGVSNLNIYDAAQHLFRTQNGTTEYGRFDSSGNLGIGTSSPARPLHVQGTTGDTYARIGNNSGGSQFGVDSSGNIVIESFTSGKDLRFYTSSFTERMRIASSGQISSFTSSGIGHRIGHAAAAGTSSPLIQGGYSASDIGNMTTSFYVWTNGNVQNSNNSYTGISDIKLKENIVDANSQWDDLKTIQVRNYNFKEETGHETFTQLGVIAQELETVCPGLVTESPDRDNEGNELGTTTKSVNYSVLYMKAVKALQEAMERIETLEAKVAALESA